MFVVTSGFVFEICQTPEDPDLEAQLPPSRCPGKPPSGSKRQTTWGVVILFSQGLGRAPVSPVHCLGCPPCCAGTGAIFIASGSGSDSQWRQRQSNPSPGPWLLHLFGWRPYRLLTVVVFHHEGHVTHCQSICLDLSFQFSSSV